MTEAVVEKRNVHINVEVAPELRERFKTICVLKQITMREGIVDALENFIDENRSLLDKV